MVNIAVELATGYVSLTVSARGIQQDIAREFSGVDSQAAAAGQTAGQSFGSRFGAGLSSFAASAAKVVAAGFAVGAAGAAVLGGAIIKTGVQYNTLEQSALAAFKTILGSGEAATTMMGSLREFAKTSPFPRQAFIEGTQQLLGFGVEAERIIPTLSAIQDSVAAVGGGANEISQITYALAQVKGQGKLTGETLNQLGQFGIDAASLLGKEFGKTSEEIRDMATSPGGIPADQVFDPLVNALTSKFGGAAEGLKGTFTGAVDRIKGAFRDISSDIIEPFVSKAGGGAVVEWANSFADILRKIQATIVPLITAALNNLVDKVGPRITNIMEGFANLNANDVQGVIERIIAAFQKVKDFVLRLKPVIAGVFAGFSVLGGGALPFIGPLLSSFNPLLVGLLAIGAASPEVRDALKPLGAVFKQLATVVKGALSKVLPVIATALTSLAGAAADLLAGGIKAIAPVFVAILDAVEPLIPIFVDLFDALSGPILDVIEDLTPVIADLAGVLGEALADAINEIAPVLPELADTLGEVATILGEQLADALTALLPALPAFATLVANAADLIAKVPPDVLAAIVGGFLLFKGVSEISGGLRTFTDRIGELVDTIGGIATKSDGTRTAIGKLIDSIGALATKAAQKIAVKIGVDLGAEAGEAGFKTALEGIFEKASASAAAFFAAHVIGVTVGVLLSLVVLGITYSLANNSSPQDIALPFLDFLPTSKEVSDAVADAFDKTVRAGWDSFWNALPTDIFTKPVVDWFHDKFTSLDDLELTSGSLDLSGIGDAVGEVADNVWQSIQDTWDSFWEGIGGFSLGDVFDKVFSFLDAGGSKGGAGSDAGVLGTIDTSFLTAWFQPAIDWFKELPGKINAALGDPIGWLSEKGKGLIDGLVNGITENVPKVIQFFTQLPGNILNWIGDTVAPLIQKGVGFIAGLLGGIAQKIPEVVSFFTTLPGKILGWLGETGNTLISKGVSLIGGFLGGMGSKLVEVANFLGDIARQIPGWLGDVGEILVEAGKKIMGGLAKGIRSGFEAVGDALSWVTDRIPFKKPIRTDHLLLLPAGLKIMEGLANGIRAGFEKTVDPALADVTEAIAGTSFKIKPVSAKTTFSVAAPSVSARDLQALSKLDIAPQVGNVLVEQTNNFEQPPTDADLRNIKKVTERAVASRLRAIG